MRTRRGLAQAAAWGVLGLAAALALPWNARGTRPDGPAGGWLTLAHGVLAGHDTLTHDYPAYWWGWRLIRQTGELPLWNPCWFGGIPFVASQTFMPFYPLNWLSAALPFPLAFNLQYPLHLALAVAVMAWTCRRRGLSWAASGLAGLSWGLGGHLATLAGPGHLQKLQTLVWLPLVALGAARLGRGHRRRVVGPLGGGLALQVTAGHLHIVYLTLVAAAAEAAWGWWTRRGRRRRAAARLLRTGGLAAAAALGLSAAFWVPTVEFARLSNREAPLDWENATRGSLPPEEALEFALPRVLGDSMPGGRGRYVGRMGAASTSAPERVVSDYVGAGVLVFALYGALAGGRRRWAAVRYGLLAAGGLAWSIGGYASVGGVNLYAWALAVVPGLAHFRAPSVAMALLAYGLAMSAALGLDAFVRGPRRAEGESARERWWRVRGSLLLLAAAAALAVVPGLAHFRAPSVAMALLAYGLAMSAALGLDAFARGPRRAEGEAARERWWRVRGSLLLLAAAAALVPALMARNTLVAYERRGLTAAAPDAPPDIARHLLWTHAVRQASDDLFITLTLAGVWAWLRMMPEGLRGRRTAAGLVFAGLIAAWTGSLVRNAAPFWRAEPLAPYQQFLTAHWALAVWDADQPPVRYLEPGNELSNRALTLTDFARGRVIGSLHGYHPVAFGRYFELARRLGFTHPQFLRLFAGRYLIWNDRIAEPPPPGFAPVAAAPGQRLLRNPTIRYARPMRAPQRCATWDEALAQLAARGDGDAPTLVLGDPPPGAPPFADAAAADVRVEAVAPLGPGVTELRVHAARPAWLIVSEPAVAGWRVRVNRRPVSMAVLDGFFLGLPLEGGENRVHIEYDPASQRLGLWMTMLALGVAGWSGGRRSRLGQCRAQRQEAAA